MKYQKHRTAVVDFETKGIKPAPFYPPEPIGVAVSLPGKRPRYYAFGHKTGNNCTKREAIEVLKRVIRDYDVCFHNGAFDMAVWNQHLGLPWLDDYHDTLFLLFLNNPRELTYSLKPSAEKWLGIPATGRDHMKDWILKNVPGAHDRQNSKTDAEHYYMNFLSECPGNIVGKYAEDDVLMTGELLDFLSPLLSDEGLLRAYEREVRTSKVIYGMEQRGVLIDEKTLRQDAIKFRKARDMLEQRIFKTLGVEAFNLASGAQLARILEQQKIVAPGDWVLTDKGNISTSRDSLSIVLAEKHKTLLDLLDLHSIYEHTLTNFVEPWLAMLNYSGNGRIYPRFHQVRGRSIKEKGGTKTGRLSSTDPNFQNLNRNPEPGDIKRFQKLIAALKIPGLELPRMRKYIVPEKGFVLLKRDYSQQEPRILAHFEGGAFLRKYQEDPRIDCYNITRAMIEEDTGIHIERYAMKVLFLSLMYGLSNAECAERIGCTVEEAMKLKAAFLKVLSGIRALQQEIRRLVADNLPIRTWGGRLYYCEKPKVIKGRLRTFEYRLLNILIQGSSAECTKEAMCRVEEQCKRSQILLQVHDELVSQAPYGCRKEEMALMREAMESVEFDLKILSDGSWSKTNYSDMEDCTW